MKRQRLTLSSLPISPSVRALNPELFKAPFSADGLVLTLPGYLPATPNTLRGKHWSVVRKEKTRATLALSRALLVVCAINPPPAPKGSRWQLHVVRRGPGSLDRDNLAASYKQLQDAIVGAGLIPGDTPRVLWATHSDSPTRRREEHGTTVMLKRVPDGDDLAPWYPTRSVSEASHKNKQTAPIV